MRFGQYSTTMASDWKDATLWVKGWKYATPCMGVEDPQTESFCYLSKVWKNANHLKSCAFQQAYIFTNIMPFLPHFS